jgi:hypothetical protein
MCVCLCVCTCLCVCVCPCVPVSVRPCVRVGLPLCLLTHTPMCDFLRCLTRSTAAKPDESLLPAVFFQQLRALDTDTHFAVRTHATNSCLLFTLKGTARPLSHRTSARVHRAARDCPVTHLAVCVSCAHPRRPGSACAPYCVSFLFSFESMDRKTVCSCHCKRFMIACRFSFFIQSSAPR